MWYIITDISDKGKREGDEEKVRGVLIFLGWKRLMREEM